MTLQQTEYQQHLPQAIDHVTMTTMQMQHHPQDRQQQSNKVSDTGNHINALSPSIYSVHCYDMIDHKIA